MAQDAATRDAISQGVRDQINAARAEAEAAARSSRAGGLPTIAPAAGGTLQLPYDPNQGPPASVVTLSIAFFMTVAAILIFWPITRAISRRISAGTVAPRVPPEISGQLTQLTQAVDAIAVEVERISEGQRFTTRLLSEQRGDQSRTMLSAAAVADLRPPDQRG
jgi:hypothetical protein